MMRAFGHRVAMCSDMLGVVGSSLKLVKFEPTTPNTSQHVATRWPNASNMLCWHVAIVWPALNSMETELARAVDVVMT